MATVTLDGVRKSYGTREVVHGVSCAVADAVTIGLRPEHLGLADDGPIPLKTELLERLGADTIVHGRLADGTRLVARTEGTLALRLGDTVHLAIAPEQIHLFDPETGGRL